MSKSKYIIASTGRSGSTMLFGLVIDSFRQKYNIPYFNPDRNWVGTFVDSPILSKHKQPVYKTHCLPHEVDFNNSRVLFVYSCPIKIIKSLYLRTIRQGIDSFYSHQKNVRGVGDFSNLFKEDVINYRRQIESWFSIEHENCKVIDLQDLWDNEAELSKYFQLNLKLPPKAPRQGDDSTLDKKFSTEFYQNVKSFYSQLAKKN